MSDHGHGHGHQHQQDPWAPPADIEDMFTEEYWDRRYASMDRVWSGNPNLRLTEEVADLDPGTALDVGCGEGGDVIWLARQGWTVTGVDVSGVVLRRAADHAAEAGVAGRTSWQRADLFALDPLPTGFDLVTASYVHVPPERFASVYRHVAASVAPGGHLVVLAHHPDDVHTGLRNSELSALLFTPQEVVDVLDPDEWEVESTRVLTREHVRDGESHVVSDTVVRARRLP